MGIEQNKRLEHLDSLRGIAAVLVSISHCFFVVSGPSALGINALLGPGSVLFFFLLSGFVLGKSIINNPVDNLHKYLAYLTRRCFRLFPMVFVSVLFYSIIALFPHLPANSFLSGKTLWMDSCVFSQSIVWWLKELFLISKNLSPVLWSMQVELCCSIILPLIIFCGNKYKFTENIEIIILSILAFFMTGAYCSGVSFYLPDNIFTSSPFHYFFAFYLGYTINRYQYLFQNVNQEFSSLILFLSFLALIPVGSTGENFISKNIGLQVSLLVLMAFILGLLIPCKNTIIKKILMCKPLLVLGRCSYSYYILHGAVIYFVLFCITSYFGFVLKRPVILISALIFLLTLPITFILSYFSQKYIESPFNQLGHHLSNKLLKY